MEKSYQKIFLKVTPTINDTYDPDLSGWEKEVWLIVVNVVCCVGRVEIQIEIEKGWCTANTDSMV